MEKEKKNLTREQQILKQKWVTPVFALFVCIWTMIVLTHYSGYSFWGDEMGTVFISNPIRSVFETLMIDVNEDVFVPPIFYLVANIWMKIAPYGTSRLLLICEIFTCAGIFITALAAQKAKNNICGIAAAILTSVLPYLATQGAYEFRHYALWFMFTAFMLWFYFRKLRDPGIMNLLLLAVSAILASYTHFSAVILFFCMFLADVYLFIGKKQNIRAIIPYLVWGILFFPYLVYAYFKARSLTQQFHWDAPALKEFFTIIPDILIDPLLIGLWGLSVAWVLFRLISCVRNKTRLFDSEHFPAFFVYWLILGYRLINFIYSRVNANYSMWTTRYFFCLLPCATLLISFALYDLVILPLCRKTNRSSALKVAAGLALVCGTIYLELNFIRACRAHRYPEIIYQPYEQGAEFLRTMDDLRSPETAIYYSAYNIEAWQYYLAHGDMTPGLFNFLPMDASGSDLSPYKTIYVMEIQNPIPEATKEKFLREFESEELHHDMKIFRLTRK